MVSHHTFISSSCLLPCEFQWRARLPFFLLTGHLSPLERSIDVLLYQSVLLHFVQLKRGIPQPSTSCTAASSPVFLWTTGCWTCDSEPYILISHTWLDAFVIQSILQKSRIWHRFQRLTKWGHVMNELIICWPSARSGKSPCQDLAPAALLPSSRSSIVTFWPVFHLFLFFF